MATDKEFSDIIDKLGDMRGGLGQLSEMMEATQQVSDTLLTSFRDFATQGSSNTLWNAVSRFSSGIFPGFWSLQNKIRAVAVYMQYVDKKQKEQIKREAEIARTITKQSKSRMSAAKTLSILNSDEMTAMEYQQLLEDDYFKSLVARLGKEEAIVKYRISFNNQLRESISSEVKLAKQVKENIENNLAYRNLYQEAGLANRDNLTEILYFTEKVEEKEKRLLQLKQQQDSFATKNVQGKLRSSSDLRKKLTDTETQLYEDLENAIKELTEEITSDKVAKGFIEQRSGVNLRTEQIGAEEIPYVEITEGEEEKERKDEGIKQLLKDGFIKKFNGITKTVKAIGVTLAVMKKQGIMNSIKRFLQPAIMVMGSLLMWITLAGLVVFALYNLGVIDAVVQLWDWFKESEWLDGMIETIMFIWEGVSTFFSGVFDFFAGLFTGDFSKIVDGLEKVAIGMFKMLFGLIDFGINLLLGWLYDLFPNLFNWWNETAKPFLDKFNIDGDKLVYMLKSLLLITAAYYIAGGGYTGAVAAAAVGIGSYLAYAGGGRVNQDGNILVGEAGPEIVSLPTNSFVTPAVQSRGKMGNNITVNVNGRVGASDAELNDIARKIGQKINRQMNQYGSSGYRA